MLKIENVDIYGWEAAIRGCRNPLNSWAKSDSVFRHGDDYLTINDDAADSEFVAEQIASGRLYDRAFIGQNDYKLMQNLCKGGSEESKWRRFVHVTCDITAPLYWISELDTYKVGTVRNSCSFMHKGLASPFEINDFSVQNQKIYTVLNPIKKEITTLKYPYETESYKLYELNNGRKYKIYRNGRVVTCEHSYTDNYGCGRTREFPDEECCPSRTRTGYYEIRIGGRGGEHWLLHRLIASVWIPNPNNYETVNHIDGDKGNNCVENLEWCTREDNIRKGFEDGLFDKNKLHFRYVSWRDRVKVDQEIRLRIKQDHNAGLAPKEISTKYQLPVITVNRIIWGVERDDDSVFHEAYFWEKYINELNAMRDECLKTKDNNLFQAIRQILPCGYNQRFTWDANYEVLSAIYRQRKNHRLDEWHQFCDFVKELPYSEFITLEAPN